MPKYSVSTKEIAQDFKDEGSYANEPKILRSQTCSCRGDHVWEDSCLKHCKAKDGIEKMENRDLRKTWYGIKSLFMLIQDFELNIVFCYIVHDHDVGADSPGNS